jgi:hypothetical protein
LECYGTQINVTNTCKGKTKLTQGSRSLLNYFSEVGEVVKMLMRLTGKDPEIDLLVSNDIFAKEEGAVPDVNVQLKDFLDYPKQTS